MTPMKMLVGVLALAVSVVVHGQERFIDKEVRVKAPLEAVWQAWTTTEGIKSFFAPDAHVEARVDGPFEIYFNPLAQPGMKGADGTAMPAFKHHVTYIARKVDGKWMDEGARAFAYVPKPGPKAGSKD